MRFSLLLLAALVTAPLATAQTGTFTFTSSQSGVQRASVTDTQGAVTLTITATGSGSSSLDATDYGGWGGTNAMTAYNNAVVSSAILTFSQTVNVASLRFVDGEGVGNTHTFVFTPNTGDPVTLSDDGTGVDVAPAGGFVGITSLTITQQGGDDFFFVVDDVVMDASLPVELTRFTATADGADALLQWQTASETNNAGFEIQVDAGTGFTAAWWLPGHGTSLETRAYAYRAEGLTPGRYRFRLKQVDFDGAFTFSPVVELTIAPRGYALAAPSTFAGEAEVRLSVGRSQQVRVALYDVAGREVQVLQEGIVTDAARFTIQGASLPSGVYFVRATGETFGVTRQIIHVR